MQQTSLDFGQCVGFSIAVISMAVRMVQGLIVEGFGKVSMRMSRQPEPTETYLYGHTSCI